MENTITQISNSLYAQFIAYIEDRSQSWASSETADLSRLRQKAFEQLKRLGFPSVKVEEWKYTNLTDFLKDDFDIFQNDDEVISLNESLIANAKIPLLDCYTIVMLNGKYRPDLSDGIPGEGIQVLPIKEAFNKEAFKTHFGKYINIEKNHFAALNTALFNDGLYIEVKDKTIVRKPIHVIHIISGENNLFLQPRNLFVVGSQCELSVIESYITDNNKEATVFVNSVAEIAIGENTKMDHYYIQSGNNKTRYIQQTEIHQQASSLYNNFKVSFPGIGLLRSNLNLVLDGVNTESHLYGIYIAGGQQLVDNHTIVDHLKPNCMSNELYKGVMKDESTGIFNGKIFVRKQAQKTNAFQKNNNLMLSKKATVDSKPQLEIFADDVKCSHGSTIGQFNDEALFYLKSRGIGDEKAKALLIQAFVFDVTEKIPDAAIRSHINQLIENALKEN
jgi:Fe-S cluster assembly protein SufD